VNSNKDLTVYAIAFSVAMLAHVGTLQGLGKAAQHFYARKRLRTVELAVLASEPPEPAPRAPAPEPKPPRPKPKPVDLRAVKAPPPQAPPPPNSAAADEPAEQARPVFGISMTSVVGPGGGSSFAMRVGNTTLKEPEQALTPPADVKPYRPVPLYKVSRMPTKVHCPEPSFPDEAKRLGIEGKVRLEVDIREDGRVGDVRVVSGLGYGLDDVAVRAMRRCKFRPAALGDGQAAATTIVYTFTFLLED
jgi:protein TonB